MNCARVFLFFLACIVAWSAGGFGEGSEPVGGWRTEVFADHPLVGSIWHVGEGRFVSREEALRHLAAAPVVLLGEKHDNEDHHRLQAEVLAGLVAAGRRPAVAFEQFDGDQVGALAEFLAREPEDASGLGEAVGWDQTGWPPWSMYQPIADIAVRHSLPILAGNLPARVARVMSRGGLDAVADDVAGLGLEEPLPGEVEAAMRQEIMDAHCDMASEAMMEPMVLVQRARDAHMARATAQGVAMADGAVLIAGAGHTRTDRAVPALLPAKVGRVMSLAFVEVVADREDPSAYGRNGQGGIPFDLVWFTPRVDDVDPCERFREQLKRLRRRAEEGAGAAVSEAPAPE